jgi:putative transcriptional regulator
VTALHFSREGQPIFARYLDTKESTVQKWEAGAKRPSSTVLKFNLVDY